MSIKIDAPYTYYQPPGCREERRRLVKEGDWRKLVAVVKAADVWYRRDPPSKAQTILDEKAIMDALYDLEKHLESQKTRSR